MATKYTFPGVYVEELPSGVRTIAGVSTSTGCFVGWAPMGPTDGALKVYSFTDYERYYGGLHPKSKMSYSVKHFFENGGNETYILRLTGPKEDRESGKAEANDIKITASSFGEWSGLYGVRIKDTSPKSDTPPEKKKFSLTVLKYEPNDDGTPNEKSGVPFEVFANLSMVQTDPRYARDIVNDHERGSIFVKVAIDDGKLDFGPDKDYVLSKGKDVPIQPSDKDFSDALDAAVQFDAAIDQIDLFNLLCIPGFTDKDKLAGAVYTLCEKKRVFLIIDCEDPSGFNDKLDVPFTGKNGAFYFPWIKATDPLKDNHLADFPPCGFVAGIYARTDSARGIWKAPAGIDANLRGVFGPDVPLTEGQNGTLNVKGVNCIRTLRGYGTVVWGARTLNGNDDRGDEWKYIPVRRTALYIEESLYRGLQWAVFEPNDEPLWAQLRLNVGAFMNDLFRQGAFQGRTTKEAYFVKCDSETTTQNDINRGIVNIIVGFAPLKPAEFVVIKLQQIAGQIAT